MTMKYLFSILFFLLIGISLQGQEETLEKGTYTETKALTEVVHLKNGSIIRGKVIEMQEGGDIKIEILGGTILSFPTSDVTSIKFEPKQRPLYNRPYQRIPRPFHVSKDQTSYQVMLMGWVAGQSQWGFRPGFSAHYVYGRQLNQYVSVGLGIGVDAYDLFDNGDGSVLYYVDFRGYLKPKTNTFYYRLGLGYGEAFTNRWDVTDSKGGIYANPIIGRRFASRSRTHFTIEYGVTIQKAQYIVESWNPVDGTFQSDEQIDIWFRRNTLKFGILLYGKSAKEPKMK